LQFQYLAATIGAAVGLTAENLFASLSLPFFFLSSSFQTSSLIGWLYTTARTVIVGWYRRLTHTKTSSSFLFYLA
jgi:hypothetical protein